MGVLLDGLARLQGTGPPWPLAFLTGLSGKTTIDMWLRNPQWNMVRLSVWEVQPFRI